MKLIEIQQQTEYPRSVREYIERYEVKTGPFLPLKFNLPNMITSWEGTPFMVYELDIKGTQLAVFEGFKLQYASNISLLNHAMESYHNIHKCIRECDSIHVRRDATNLLGLFRCVKKPTNMFPNRIRLYDSGDQLDKQATEFINKLHAEMDDIYQIQNALIDAGLSDDQADL